MSAMRSKSVRRRPTPHHWQLLLDDDRCFGLEDFLRFWDVTPLELSRICCCSRWSMRRWLNGSVELPELCRIRLMYVHQLWLSVRVK